MLSTKRLFSIAPIISLLILGCTPQTEIVKLYEDSSTSKSSLDRLLVISVSSSEEQQRMFEDQVVAHLRARNVVAVASHTLINGNSGLLQEDMDRLSAEINADGILITNTVSVNTSVDVEEGRTSLRSECRGGDLVDYFLYDHVTLKEPDTVKVSHSVAMVTSLYKAQDQKRLWTIQSTCFDRKNMSDAIRDEAEAIVRQLEFDHWI